MALGEQLRNAREARGLTPSQVAEATRMMVQIVEGIEHEDFRRVAAPIYGKGFIRLYADLVGLDPAPLIDEYMRRFARRTSPLEPLPGGPAPVARLSPPDADVDREISGSQRGARLSPPAVPPTLATLPETSSPMASLNAPAEPDLFSPPSSLPTRPPPGIARPTTVTKPRLQGSARVWAESVAALQRIVRRGTNVVFAHVRLAAHAVQLRVAQSRVAVLRDLPRYREFRGIFWISTVGVVLLLLSLALVLNLLSRRGTAQTVQPQVLYERIVPLPLPYVD